VKIAFFSPLPPAQSGIADYAAALLDAMRTLAQVDAFAETPASFDPDRYDAILYHLGKQPLPQFTCTRWRFAIRASSFCTKRTSTI
jgi:hypothetical protein